MSALSLETSPDESQAISRFCRLAIETQHEHNVIREARATLLARRDDAEAVLRGFLGERSLTCVPISIEDQARYLRLQSSTQRRSVSRDLVMDALTGINGDRVRQAGAWLAQSGAEPAAEAAAPAPLSMVQVLGQAVFDAILDRCTYHRVHLTITDRRERPPKAAAAAAKTRKRKKGEDDADEKAELQRKTMPAPVLRAVAEYQRVGAELATLTARKSRTTRRTQFLMQTATTRPPSGAAARNEPDPATADLNASENQRRQQAIAQYLQRVDPQKSSCALMVRDERAAADIRYYLRKKAAVRKPPFAMSSLSQVVRDSVRDALLQRREIPFNAETPYVESRVAELLNEDLLASLVDDIDQHITDWRVRRAYQVEYLTLQRAPDRKKRAPYEDRAALATNRVSLRGSADADAEDGDDEEEGGEEEEGEGTEEAGGGDEEEYVRREELVAEADLEADAEEITDAGAQ